MGDREKQTRDHRTMLGEGSWEANMADLKEIVAEGCSQEKFLVNPGLPFSCQKRFSNHDIFMAVFGFCFFFFSK